MSLCGNNSITVLILSCVITKAMVFHVDPKIGQCCAANGLVSLAASEGETGEGLYLATSLEIHTNILVPTGIV